MHRVLAYVIVLFCLRVTIVDSFSSMMTSSYCDKVLKEGLPIMGQQVQLGSAVTVKVKRDGQELQDGSIYFPSEQLSVYLEPKITEMVFEVTGAEFKDGECNRTRSLNQGAILIMPSSGVNVTVVAGWARSYSSGVKITDYFSLVPHVSTEVEL